MKEVRKDEWYAGRTEEAKEGRKEGKEDKEGR